VTGRAEGWWWPIRAHRAHYFREGRSLCGRWISLAVDPLHDEPSAWSDACNWCYGLLEVEKAVAG
jgi:hypothetical protein